MSILGLETYATHRRTSLDSRSCSPTPHRWSWRRDCGPPWSGSRPGWWAGRTSPVTWTRCADKRPERSPMLSFTAHNIELGDGRRTIPDKPLLSDTAFTRSVLRTFELAFCDRDLSKVRVIDLGCLEGGYTVALARAGYDVTG